MNVTDGNIEDAVKYLADRDDDLARLLKEDGVPPLWDRRPGFTSLINIILEQQVSLASAKSIFNRITDNIVPFTPAHVLEVGVDELRSFGVTRQKAQYCVNVATAMTDGILDLPGMAELDDHMAMEMLTQIKGIGPWTARIYLLMVLLRPDIWPPGDIALIKTVRNVKMLPPDSPSSEVTEVAEQWVPYRSVAARMMWHHYLAGSGT